MGKITDLFKSLFSGKRPNTNDSIKNNSGSNINQLITSSDINRSIIELDNYICELCKWGDNLSVLSDPQKTFYFNQELEREINNGGFSQYFHNSSGKYALETVESLKKIGADKTAEILSVAINNRTAEELEKLDQQFFKYDDNLNELNIEFVRTNKEYF